MAQFESADFERNFIASAWQELIYVAPNTIVRQVINNNTYHFYNVDCTKLPFAVGSQEIAQTVAQWTAGGLDANSTINQCGVRPTGVQVSIRPNAYDSNRTHVIINNYSKSATVNIDLSSVLHAGDSFEIRNAQDYYGPLVASGTYQGGPISIPMAGLTIAQPIGWSGAMIRSSGPDFGAFILIKK